MFAHPRVTQDESALAHDLSETSVVFTVPLSLNKDNKLSGTAHISGEHLSRICGQPNADLIHLDNITTTQTTSNVAVPTGVHFSIGNTPETHANFESISRQNHVCGETGNITACHVVVPPSSIEGQVSVFSPNVKTSADFTHGPTQRAATEYALSRSLRWAPETLSGNMSGSCTKVTAGEQTRWLLPNSPEHAKCAMSKLFLQNQETGSGFCQDRYSVKNRTEAIDQKGRNCTVVTGSDFANISSQLSERLKTSSPLDKGLTVNVESLTNGDDTALHAAMTEKNHAPMVTLSATFNRIPTKQFLEETHPGISDQVHTAAHFHEMLGEDANVSQHMTAIGSTASSFAENIMKLNLNVQEEAVATAADMTKATIVEGGDEA